ncbi:adenylate/guanylate cyclase domain-containing protein [Pedobacter endophyticus]|uniref:Adenylate/guanylate cyclase domain-containing protein n=1 Tax=Pedobacter endophyticus TaxID=2789740 RepID=A0A7U3SPL5_9SPHI|nr:adenylate/guanylate cyclase domain-containing protein [Pedobacter endophyticus]QPH38633.1 adenylate/guanylate cyclase domain-containing protein [Pedobacter endophyticus]
MASIKDIITEIETDITDVVSTNFTFSNTTSVPNRSDGQLTFERNVEKKGKILKTCVLYVDIRDSVALTEKHHNITMGKIYTAFTKGVLKAAKHHGGHIRNIIGDRVMIVFPSENSFKNAVHCAITINHLSKYVIRKKFPAVDFKCGIGIDHGELRVIKVGLQRQGHEGTENRSLVWAGYPANIASRLTDVANKTIDETIFKVTRNPVNPARYFNSLGGFPLTQPTLKMNEPYYLTTEETVEMNAEDFAKNIWSYKGGPPLDLLGGKLINFSKENRAYRYPEILMTRTVFNGYTAANPSGNDVTGAYWKLQSRSVKNVSVGIYGGDITWLIN